MRYELLQSAGEVDWANKACPHPGFRWKLGDTLPERESQMLRDWRREKAQVTRPGR